MELNPESLGSKSTPEIKLPSSQLILEEKSCISENPAENLFQGTKFGRINLQHRKTVNFVGLGEVSAIQVHTNFSESWKILRSFDENFKNVLIPEKKLCRKQAL
jgi:hypothetical protein